MFRNNALLNTNFRVPLQILNRFPLWLVFLPINLRFKSIISKDMSNIAVFVYSYEMLHHHSMKNAIKCKYLLTALHGSLKSSCSGV